MKVTFLPKTSFGKKSLILFIAFFILMIASNVASILSQTEINGNMTMNPVVRPFVIVGGLIGMLSGLSGFVLSLIAIFKQKERSVLVALPLILGAGLIFLLIGELVVPH